MSSGVPSDECSVYLCNTPILQGATNLASRALSFSSDSLNFLCGDLWNKHWLLVFDYGGDRVLICQAFKDGSGDLTAWMGWRKKAAFNDTFPSKKDLGRHNVPEAFLGRVMKEQMCDSGPYHATSNNCQTWALRLLRALGIERPVDEYHAEEIVNDIFVPLAKGGAAIAGAAALTAGILRIMH